MAAESKIIDAMALEGVPIEGEIVSSATDKPKYFVTIVVQRDSSGKQVPSNLLLHSLREKLALDGIDVEFLLRYEDSEQIETGLRATLLHSHIDQIRNVFVSFESNNAHVWIEPKGALEETVIHDLLRRAQSFFDLFELRLTTLSITTDEILPTKLAILTAIRLLAPASLTSLSLELVRRGFTVPSPDWLVRRLDALRKSGNVVRLMGGELTLTAHSLHALGTSKDRWSADIARLLALAKKDG